MKRLETLVRSDYLKHFKNQNYRYLRDIIEKGYHFRNDKEVQKFKKTYHYDISLLIKKVEGKYTSARSLTDAQICEQAYIDAAIDLSKKIVNGLGYFK